jgi:hypothetical protein
VVLQRARTRPHGGVAGTAWLAMFVARQPDGHENQANYERRAKQRRQDRDAPARPTSCHVVRWIVRCRDAAVSSPLTVGSPLRYDCLTDCQSLGRNNLSYRVLRPMRSAVSKSCIDFCAAFLIPPPLAGRELPTNRTLSDRASYKRVAIARALTAGAVSVLRGAFRGLLTVGPYA